MIAIDLLVELARELANEVAGEERDVFRTVLERRDGELDHRKTIEEIFAETAGRDSSMEIAMRGSDDADVDLACGEGTDGKDFLVLDGAEKLRLRWDGHITNLVEEEGASVGEFEQANLVAIRSGEGAFDVAEELALEEGFDDSGAVQHDEFADGRRCACAEQSLRDPCRLLWGHERGWNDSAERRAE